MGNILRIRVPSHWGRLGPLAALLAANAVAIAGTTVSMVAIPWFVLEITGSATRTGGIAAFEALGLGVSAVLSAPLVDRVGARRCAVAADVLSATLVAAIPLLYATVGVSFAGLAPLALVLGACRSPSYTARSVLLREKIRAAGVTTERATSTNEGLARFSRLLGAPLAGVLIAALGAPYALLFTSGSFLLAAFINGLLVGRTAPPKPVPMLAPETNEDETGRAAANEPTKTTPGLGVYIAELADGLRQVARDRLLRAIVLMVMATNMMDAATVTTLVPIYARRVFHSSVSLGLMDGALSVGMIAGSGLFAWLGPRLPRRTVYFLLLLAGGAPRFFVLAVEPGMSATLAVMCLSGVALGAVNPLLFAVLYERVPDGVLARVLGVVTAGVLAGEPVGAAGCGILVDQIGLSGTLLLFGSVYAVLVSAIAVFPVWRQLDSDRRAAVRVDGASPISRLPEQGRRKGRFG